MMEAHSSANCAHHSQKRPSSGPATRVESAASALVRYLANEGPWPQLPRSTCARPAFQARVWEALTYLAPGAITTYGELAAALGDPNATRAVARACAMNPVALLIPCHRVIAKNGRRARLSLGDRTQDPLARHRTQRVVIDPADLNARLDERGYAVVPGLLDTATCAALVAEYDDGPLFRSTIVMQRHGYGRGEYRYFRYPLPPHVQALRESLYTALVPAANAWSERLGSAVRFPEALGIDARSLPRCRPGAPDRAPCCAIAPATTTRCIRTSTARSRFRCRRRSCSATRRRSPAASSSWSRPSRASRGVAHVVPLGLGDCIVFPNRLRPNAGGRAFDVPAWGWLKCAAERALRSVSSFTTPNRGTPGPRVPRAAYDVAPRLCVVRPRDFARGARRCPDRAAARDHYASLPTRATT